VELREGSVPSRTGHATLKYDKMAPLRGHRDKTRKGDRLAALISFMPC